MSYSKNKTQLCDPFDLKLRDRFTDYLFAYHNPSARLKASLTESAKRGQIVLARFSFFPGKKCRCNIGLRGRQLATTDFYGLM